MAPMLWTGASLATTRLLLAAVSGAALLSAFGLWVPVIGLGAVGAAVVFGSSWVGLLYGSEVMPNLWTALSGVAALGVVARLVSGDPVRAGRVTVAGLLAVMALFRPLDAVVFAGALCLGLAVVRRADRGLIVPLVVGPVVGAVPWVAEFTVRLGDPATALRAAAEVGHLGAGSAGDTGLQYLALADGPLLGPQADVTLPVWGIAWLVGLVALATAALVRGRRGRDHTPIVLAGLAGLALTAEYVFLVEAVAPRFLLPAYAMFSIVAGVGLVGLLHGRSGVAGPIALIALAAAWVGWHGATAVRLEAAAAAERRVPEQVGSVLADIAQDERCVFASSDSFPQISRASGCRGRQLRGAGDVPSLVVPDRRSFLIVRGAAPSWAAVLDGVGASSITAGHMRWHIYELAPSGGAIGEGRTDELTPSPASP